MNITRVKIILLILIVIFTAHNCTEVKATEATTAGLIQLTSTEQETDYYVKIGTTTYNINTLNTLADAAFALLEWEAKGSDDTKIIVGNFNNISYSGFDDVYAMVYDLMLESATKTISSGSSLITSANTVISDVTIWKIEGTVSTQTGYITCPQDAKLIIIAEESATLKYANAASRINVGREDKDDAGEVAFLGRNSTNKITISGLGTSTVHSKSPIIVKSGSLYLNNVTIKNFSFSSSSNCAINFPSGHDAARYMYMSNSTMDSIVGTHSPAIFCRAYYTDGTNVENEKSRLYLYNNSFSNCKIKNSNSAGDNLTETNGGAVIRSYAADNCGLRAEKCVFENNKAGTGNAQQKVNGSGGGAIYWKSVANSISLINCNFKNNSTTCVGGAVYNTGKMEIKGCFFGENYANYGGGAIASEPPVTSNQYENIDVTSLKGTLIVDKDTVIKNNSSGMYGGGIFFNAIKAQIKEEIETYEMELIINGATFTSNISDSYGGAIAMYLDYGDYNYKTGININEGSSFKGNSAQNNGGAIWMGNAESCECNLTDGVIMNGGSLEENNAKDGGAICIESEKLNVSMNFLINDGIIKNNVASNNGGAIYLSGGDFIINGGSIGQMENDIKQGNRAIQGGAIFVTGGSFTMNGGTVEGNTATQSGGAIQISDGNVYITDGKISSNVARGESTDAGYGGGIFIDGGEIVSITGGEISNNVAAKNGGGIEVKTDKEVTVDIYSGKFINNVADECGGAIGIECDTGTINVGKEGCDGLDSSSHIHPELSGNLAGVQGGGFYMTGTDAILNIYCGLVDNNIVVDIENNFDQSSGTVTVYEGVLIGNQNEGIIVVGGTFVDKRKQDEEKIKVIYYSNYNGSTEYSEALITRGSVITMPGNIFGVEGYEILGWVKDINNTSVVDYEVGEVVETIEDLTLYAIWVIAEKNEPTFMIIIPTEITVNNTKTVVFNMETTLNLLPRDKMLKISLKEEDFKLKLIKNDVVIDAVDYKLIKNGSEIGSDGLISEFYSDSTLITYNKKEELEIFVLGSTIYAGDYEDMLTFEVVIEDI